MSPTLGGSLIIKDGIKYDYTFLEAIQCLIECCDEVAVVAFTDEDIVAIREKFKDEKKLKTFKLDQSRWETIKGHEKLSYWTNFCKEMLSTDYHLNIQGDEILHEDSYQVLREAIATGQEGFLMRRFNMWGSPFTYLNETIIGKNRMPCSDYIVRLAKIKYESVGDAESLSVVFNTDFKDRLKIFHMGFTRRREIMVEKIYNMQKHVFEVEPDKRIEGMTIFKPEVFFTKEQCLPIEGKLPRLIQTWAEARVYAE